MKIGMRHLHLFILLFAASSLLFQLPPEVFASTPSDITATDSETDGVNSFDELEGAQALTLEEKSKFSIVDPEPEMDPKPEMDPEPEPEMDPEPEQTKKEKSKRQRR